jgi:uncharacterized protein
MERNEAISKLGAHEADLRRLSVERLYVFASTARGEAREDSDVDLFFDDRKGDLGPCQLMDFKDLASILGRSTAIQPL